MNDMQRPLDEAELDELGEFLDDHAVPEDGMSLEMLDGFLTAIVSGPDHVLPSEWLPRLWHPEGGEHEWESPEQAQRILDLVMRHMNGVVTQLQARGDEYSPLLIEFGEGEETVLLAQEWALGYLQGISLREDAWLPLIEDPDYSDEFAALEDLAQGPEDVEIAAIVAGQPQRDALIGVAIGFALDAGAYWAEQRGVTPVR